MKTVWQCVGEFGRKRSLQDQLCYLGQMLDRFGEDPRIGRIVAAAARSRRLVASYDRAAAYTPRGKYLLPLPPCIPAREPTAWEAEEKAQELATTILESLNHPDRLLVRMAFGIGRKKLTQVRIARKLRVTTSTVRRRLRSILTVIRIQTEV